MLQCLPGTSSSSSSTVAIGAFPSVAVRKEHISQQRDREQLQMMLDKQLVSLQRGFRNLYCHVACLRTLFGKGLCESPEARQAVGSQLVQDTGQHLGQLLGLSVASDGEGVGCEGGLHFRIVEVDHCPLVCKHVNLQETKLFTAKKFKTNDRSDAE